LTNLNENKPKRNNLLKENNIFIVFLEARKKPQYFDNLERSHGIFSIKGRAMIELPAGSHVPQDKFREAEPLGLASLFLTPASMDKNTYD